MLELTRSVVSNIVIFIILYSLLAQIAPTHFILHTSYVENVEETLGDINFNNQTSAHNRSNVEVVEIDLSPILDRNIRLPDIIVTILNDSREIELPYIPKPEGEIKNKYLIDTLYKGMSINKLSPIEFKQFINKLKAKEIDLDKLKYRSAELRYLKTSVNASSIVVFIDNSIEPSIDGCSGWYYRALVNGLEKRAKYTYKGYTIYVYYSESGRDVQPIVLIPHDIPDSIVYTKIYRALSSNSSRIQFENKLVINTHILSNTRAIRKASFLRIEENNSIYETQYNGGFLWYIRPWSSENPKAGDLGGFRNRTLTGSTYYSISDRFSYKYNTTRYEIWIWISADKHVYLNFKLYLDNNNVWDTPITLEPGVLYGFGVVVHTVPEEPGNYLQPAPNSVYVALVLSEVSDSTAKILVNAIAVARAYIEPVGFYVNGVYPVHNRLRGVGDILSSNSIDEIDEAADERFHFIFHEEALFTFLTTNNIFEIIPTYSYPRIYIYVESSPDQRYDRYVSLYINGKLLSRKLAYNPNTPNGTVGKRSVSFHLSKNNDVFQEILSSIKMGVSPTIKVVIEGFKKPENYNGPYEDNWFIKYGGLSYFSRASCTLNILYSEDPTKMYDETCRYITSIEHRFFNGIQLWNKVSDIRQHQILFGYQSPRVGSAHDFIIIVDVNPTSKKILDNGMAAGSYIHKVRMYMNIWSTRAISLDLHSFWGPSGDNVRGAIESIQWGLWIISLSGSILGFISGNWFISTIALAATALSCPALYVYGANYVSSCTPYGSNGLKCVGELEIGWDYVTKAPVTHRIAFGPDEGLWTSSDYVRVYYSIKIYESNWDELGSTTYVRYGTLATGDIVYVRPLK